MDKEEEMEGLEVRRFQTTPSVAEFARVEDANVPAVFEGCVRSWPAFRLWDPATGGLERLKRLAGAASVQVMATTSGPNFYGDLRGHDRIPLQFASFLDLATMQGSDFSFLGSGDVQLYLAQAGIVSCEGGAPPPLSALREDLDAVSFVTTPATAVNLWMSVNGSRSSTHYDPFHNLLCVISGCKEVRLWPPSAAPALYPRPVFGEASNHSEVDFANPDLAKHPRFRAAMARTQRVTLRAGDALFLPEGWYHQVDSAGVTIAVNSWWPSAASLRLGSHMDAYLLRRLLANLLDSEKDSIVAEFRKSVEADASPSLPPPRRDIAISSTSLTDAETRALRTLVLCGSDTRTSAASAHPSPTEPDTIAGVFSTLDARSLQRILLVMSVEYPRTWEALLLRKLRPLAAEILTRRFEEMDGESELEVSQEEFYAQIYSVFDDPGRAMAALVDGKEALAAVALQRVLEAHLGLSCTLPPSF